MSPCHTRIRTRGCGVRAFGWHLFWIKAGGLVRASPWSAAGEEETRKNTQEPRHRANLRHTAPIRRLAKNPRVTLSAAADGNEPRDVDRHRLGRARLPNGDQRLTGLAKPVAVV